MAAEDGVIITYIFTGEEERNELGRYIIPQNATHFSIHESITVIPRQLFFQHQNILELICHAGVKRIEEWAFNSCPRLRRVIIPGVEVVEAFAFCDCNAVTNIECDKLERIGEVAFYSCTSLGKINLPSAKIVERSAFACCTALADPTFSKNLESIEGFTFFKCFSLERITIPLKNGLITDDAVFDRCDNLRRVDLLEEAVIRDTIDALLLVEWRNDMNAAVASINCILPNTRAGTVRRNDVGRKAIVIQEWITRVLRKVNHYKEEHRRLLDEVTSTLQVVLPHDIAMNNVRPFLEVPLHTFEV